MSDKNETVAISGRDMVEYRRIALELAIKSSHSHQSVAALGHVGGQFLGLLMALQPVGVESAIVAGPVDGAAEGPKDKPATARKRTTLKDVNATGESGSPASTTDASAGTSNSGAIAPSSAPAQQVASQPQMQAAVPGSNTTASTVPATTAANTGATLVSAPVSLTEAAAVLKVAVGDPARGREFVKALLAKYKVEIMSQIPAPKLADFVRDLNVGQAALSTQSDANDPLKGLI